MTSKTVVAFGHSHLTCLQSAYEAPKSAGDDPIDAAFLPLWGRYEPFVRDDANGPRYNESLVDDLKAQARRVNASAFVASLIGSEHLIWAVEGQQRPFDVVLPYDPDLPRVPDAEILPYAALRGSVLHAIGSILRFAGWLQKETDIPVTLVLPPPPAAEDHFLMEDSPGYLQELMIQAGTPHWAIRYKLWRIWVEVATSLMQGDDVKIVGAPEGVVDSRGLLRAEYCADCVHGNQAYGTLIWRRLGAPVAAEAR
jgi:hypothetical protein